MLLLTLTLSLFSGFATSTPDTRATLLIQPPPEKTHWVSPVQKVPLEGVAPFLSFFIVWEGAGESLEVRFSDDDIEWSVWERLPRDPHNQERRITQPFFAPAGSRYFQVRYQEMTVRSMTCHFFSPGITPEVTPKPSGEVFGRTDECPLPELIDRSQWCPDNSCPPQSTPTTTEVTHLIIHHSAGLNTAEDWGAVVRSIWDLHVNGNGWSDIGYNFLIDPNGLCYEGRGNDVMGAHFCGSNSKTMGVCVLGNFQDVPPTEAALDKLTELLAWKANDRNLDPLGRAVHSSSQLDLYHISGHRDGCATSCPGDRFYPLLPEVRIQVGDFLTSCQGATAIDSPRGADLRSSTTLFPNPAGEILNLDLQTPRAGEVKVEIFDISGKRLTRALFQKPGGPATFSLPLNGLPAGQYAVRIFLAGEMTYGKLTLF